MRNTVLWNGFKVGNIGEYQYIIALDFGHGECTACLVNIATGTVEKIKLDKGEYELPTAILYEESSGRCAVGASVGGKEETLYYFKESPDRYNKYMPGVGKRYEEVMNDFLRAVMDVIRARLSIRGSDKVLLLVGCPSSKEKWLDYKFKYAGMIEKAAKVSKVVIMQESRASIINAINNSKLDIDLRNGVMVFDFGSSTVDCTHFQTGKPYLETSWRLGASKIEQLILKKAVRDESGEEIRNVMLPSDEARLEYRIRRKKESFYNGEDVEDSAIQLFEIEEDEHGEKRKKAVKSKVFLSMTDEFMDEVVRQEIFQTDDNNIPDYLTARSWYDYCRLFFEEMKKDMIKHGRSCRTIVLTGGASRMDFVVRLCKDVFGSGEFPGVRFFRDENPSFCVSQGLAYASLQDIQGDKILESLPDKIDFRLNDKFDVLSASCKSAITSKYMEQFDQAMSTWASSTTDQSIDMLRARIESQIKEAFPEIRVKKVIYDSFNDWFEKQKEGIQEVVNQEFRQIYKNSLSKEDYTLDTGSWKRIFEAVNITNNTQGSIDKIIKNLDPRGFVTKFVNVVSYITGMICGLVGFVVDFLNPFRDKDEFPVTETMFNLGGGMVGEATDVDTKKSLNASQRAKVQKQYKEKLRSEMKSDMEGTVSEAIDSAWKENKKNRNILIEGVIAGMVGKIAFYDVE